ncbi:MAG: VOC family protein, partial [Thermoleophilaceae bacterium]
MKVTGVDFITVPTRDFDRASDFYGGVLGLPCSTRWGDMPAAEFETGTLTSCSRGRRLADGRSPRSTGKPLVRAASRLL